MEDGMDDDALEPQAEEVAEVLLGSTSTFFNEANFALTTSINSEEGRLCLRVSGAVVVSAVAVGDMVEEGTGTDAAVAVAIAVAVRGAGGGGGGEVEVDEAMRVRGGGGGGFQPGLRACRLAA